MIKTLQIVCYKHHPHKCNPLTFFLVVVVFYIGQDEECLSGCWLIIDWHCYNELRFEYFVNRMITARLRYLYNFKCVLSTVYVLYFISWFYLWWFWTWILNIGSATTAVLIHRLRIAITIVQADVSLDILILKYWKKNLENFILYITRYVNESM